jgi:hypothetical protein
MEKHQINPERITKPIQLLGAWLVGLLAIDASFLFAATSMGTTAWQSSALTVAAIVNVPIFIVALFLLQTRFRPELQEDSFYSTYLNSKTNELVKIPMQEIQYEEMKKRLEVLENRQQLPPLLDGRSRLTSLSYGVNVHLTNQDEVADKLREIGVDGIRKFGEQSAAPDGMKVAIAARIPREIRREVTALACQLGFEQFSTIHPWEEVEEDVLFGSYGDVD